jgi:peptidoglycan/LPS O-acetylase OafA/YrhL
LKWRGGGRNGPQSRAGYPPVRRVLAFAPVVRAARRPSRTAEVAVPADAALGVAGTRVFFPELEALRGLAALLVFAFHVDGFVLFGQPTAPSALNCFVRAGHTGVDLFFLLSGFLLALPFVADGLGGRHVSVRTYFTRRALRILPLYYAAVLVGTVLSATAPRDLLHALPYFLFLNSFAGTVTPLPPYHAVWWSLATEVQFYLLLPLLPLALRTRRGRIAGGVALAAYALAYAAMVTGRLHMPTRGAQFTFMFSSFARGPLFLWGIAAAFLYHLHGERLRARLGRSVWLRAGGADALLATVVVGLVFLLRWVVAIGPARAMGATDQPWHIVNGALWTGVLLLLLLAPLRSKRLVCNAVLGRLGVLSYSIYILHVPLMSYGLNVARPLIPGLFTWNLQTFLVVAALSAVCYGAATLTYTWIERPFLVRKSRFE